MPEEEVRKVEIDYPKAFCRAALAGGARVCGVMTAVGANPESWVKYTRIIGEKEKAAAPSREPFAGCAADGFISLSLPHSSHALAV